MADALIFYTNPQSRGQIVHWMLEELGQPYETRVVEYGAEMKSPDYLALNPMGKVPTLVHKGAIVTECAAICAYLADAFPDAGLAPPLDQRAAYYRWMFFAAGPLETAALDRAFKHEVPEESRPTSNYGEYSRVMDALEVATSASDYITGDAFTAADVYVGSHVLWGVKFGTIEPRPAFETYAARLKERPALKRTGGIAV